MEATKKNLLRYLDDISGFEVVSSSSDIIPEGLTNELLYNLFDIGLKFSQTVSIRGGVTFIVFFDDSSGIVIELFEVTRHEKIKKDGFVVTIVYRSDLDNRSSLVMGENTVGLGLKNGLGLVWDSRLEIKRLEAMISAIDEFAQKNLQIKKGKRPTIPIDFRIRYN